MACNCADRLAEAGEEVDTFYTLAAEKNATQASPNTLERRTPLWGSTASLLGPQVQFRHRPR
jgi:hypothetical protein